MLEVSVRTIFVYDNQLRLIENIHDFGQVKISQLQLLEPLVLSELWVVIAVKRFDSHYLAILVVLHEQLRGFTHLLMTIFILNIGGESSG